MGPRDLAGNAAKLDSCEAAGAPLVLPPITSESIREEGSSRPRRQRTTWCEELPRLLALMSKEGFAGDSWL
jgi:hypothetical protein